ncbi:MAG TPA: head decoration protein [Longimicrobiaceae bacterium]|nr:head decoration protein [Longimicrobiaceae bacterium]
MSRPEFGTQGTSMEGGARSGEFPCIRREVAIAVGQNLAAHSVLGRVTATGEYVLSAAAAGDGSQAVRAVLTEAVDATGAVKKAVADFTGEFDPDKLVFGAGHTAASTEDAMRDLSIFYRKRGKA